MTGPADDGSRRIALRLEYDGAAFAGWQVQPHAPSVQQTLERALSAVADHPVEVTAAGRTDSGVHATAQVVHFDTTARRQEHQWVLGANAHLPEAVSVLSSHHVEEGFHARYTAVLRGYRYVFLCRRSRPALLRGRVGWTPRALDVERMHRAAQGLLGEQDFTAYRAAACQAAHAVRRLHRLDVHGDGALVTVDVEANAFLHHMVRNLAGTLMEVGTGERPVRWPREVLEARDRRRAGMTAPAEGLYLCRVVYPEEHGVPSSSVAPSFA